MERGSPHSLPLTESGKVVAWGLASSLCPLRSGWPYLLAYTHTLTRTHTCTHRHTHTYIHTAHRHTYTDTLTDTHTHTYIYTCTQTHTHMHSHSHTYTGTRAQTHLHIHILTYTHTHTHTHTHTPPSVIFPGHIASAAAMSPRHGHRLLKVIGLDSNDRKLCPCTWCGARGFRTHRGPGE